MLFLAFGRKLSRNLLRYSFDYTGNFRGQLLSHTKLIALNAEHGDLLWQTIQNLAEAKCLRQSESVT